MNLPNNHNRNRLNVLFYLYFPGGGIGRYTARLMPELTELGHAVSAAVVPEFEWQDSDAYECWPNLMSISHRLPPIRKAKFLLGQLVNPKRLAQFAKISQPDVIHICNINHLSFPFWKNRIQRLKVPIVASAHDVKRAKAIISRSWEERQLKAFYRFATHLFVHSNSQKEELADFANVPESNITVVPHGPYDYPSTTRKREEIRRELGIQPNTKLGLSFGLVRDEKNVDGLIRALVNLPDEYQILVAGSTVSGHRPIEHYQQLADELGVTSQVHFRSGYVPDNEVADLFTASDWIALTYKTNFSSQSGVLNSAVNYERPILATPAPAFTESLTEFSIGELCDGDKPDDIRSGLMRLFSNERAYEFPAYRRHHSWTRNAELTQQVYLQVTDRK